MPGTKTHGLEHKLVLYIILLNLLQFLEFILEANTSTALNKNGNEHKKEECDADSPQRRNEIHVLTLGI
jgi:hypothetical protein